MNAVCRVSATPARDGYEISIPEKKAVDITRAFLADDNCEPAGLGARDSLRLEAGLCLYGSDIDTQTSPIEASLIWAIQKRRREEGGFPGAERIQREIADGPSRRLVGIRPEGRAPARHGVEVRAGDGSTIGEITSGSFGPTAGGPVAIGVCCLRSCRAGHQGEFDHQRQGATGRGCRAAVRTTELQALIVERAT